MQEEHIFGTTCKLPCSYAREQVIRCRSCKYSYEVIWPATSGIPDDYLDCHGGLVELWDYYRDQPKRNPVPPDGFCFCGEPKGGDSDAR